MMEYMRIDYDLTREDYLAYSIHHMEHSKSIKRSLFIQRYLLSLIFFVFPFIMANATEVPLAFWLAAYTIIYILWVIYYPRYFVRSTKKRITKMINEGKNENLFGAYSIALTEDGVEQTSKTGESSVTWGGIERIDETKDHIFIYLSSVSAYVIPIRAFDNEEQKKEFMRILRREK